MEQTVTNIPAEAVNWLLLQGWLVIEATYDDTTVPPTPYYTMTREPIQRLNQDSCGDNHG